MQQISYAMHHGSSHASTHPTDSGYGSSVHIGNGGDNNGGGDDGNGGNQGRSHKY